MDFQEAMMNDNGFLFFRFSSVDGLRQVMEGGPCMIRGVPLFVFPWDPMQGLVKPEHKTCPLWVKLHNIPLVAFNREGVGRIASTLGKPKMMDDYTTSMCDNAWGRPGFAKVLVDVWAVGDLKREVDVVVPTLYGGKGTEVKIRVEYLWEPIQCSHCSVFGHKLSSCVKVTVAKSVSKGKGKEIVDDDGFTKIQNRKQKGGDTSTGLSSSLAAVGVSSVKDSVVPSSAPPITLDATPTVVEQIPVSDQLHSSTDDVVAKTKHLADLDSFANLREYLARKGQDISMSNKFSSLESLDSDVITMENQPSPSVLETHLGVSKLPDVASAVFGAWSWNSNQPDESLGGSTRRDIRMEEFLECLEASNLFDIRFQGNFFTWAQKPTSGVGILRKLDRVLVNTDFSDSFHLSSARFLPRGISDDSPAILMIKHGRIRGRLPFRFDNFLAQRSDFLSTVSDAWRMSVHGTDAEFKSGTP
ncbi:hypothetical protein OSB04_011989 [Centaurea solstitialis]|uniref:DUF4283 domain-containing protein n=1 Tax=Centaurea solstitialis TaxID=347529 RepID=A0AA38WM15_9ASTR|nr:hypothetical protein OSB04_011989 [Centaurea solstitialis]